MIRTIIIFNFYNLNINITLIKAINNHKNYNQFYKKLKELVLYKDNFTTLFSPLKVVIIILYFNISLEDDAISRA
ncbi:hypothetical protein C8035_v003512 [Colletotrichum spinosum]|uniref:Uncharacterized protein n=1 Tax=Colletotrichum spinosum TaxID=1347390 RepID=A0A4R8PV21_9PEZI|nr:hypothetical protein C8035_v003512 [Colletotrichum spinosum]